MRKLWDYFLALLIPFTFFAVIAVFLFTLLFASLSSAADLNTKLAAGPGFVGMMGAGTSGPTCITADVLQQLEATDFLTSPPSLWTVTDTASRLSMSTSGENTTRSCFNSTTDTGARGMAVSLATTTTVGYAIYTPAASHANLTTGFWFYTAALADWAGTYSIVRIYGASDNLCRGYQVNDAGDKTKYFGLRGTGAVVKGSAITQGAWYWISLKVIKNTSCTMKVFDASGSQVGSDITATAANLNTTAIYYGLSEASPAAVASSMYFDDVVIDWTTAASPLGP